MSTNLIMVNKMKVKPLWDFLTILFPSEKTQVIFTPFFSRTFLKLNFLLLVDEFTCDGRVYGYYADVANECQIFHICYPVTYADGIEEMLKWSFICPAGTIFDQVRHINR